MSTIERCIACGSSRWRACERWQSYNLAKCDDCGVTYTVNPDYTQERYVAAYEPGAPESPVPAAVHVYRAPEAHLRLEGAAFPRLVPPPRLTAAERVALRWLKEHAPRGALVVDCGCGTGRFLQALSKAGFRPVGVELSESLVGLLRRRRLDAIVGGAPDFPWQGPCPFAITFCEVLEHLPDPGGVIAPLRDRFPASWILATVPSPSRAYLLSGAQRNASDYPPNHYVRWTPVGLTRFFERLGYSRVLVVVPPPLGSEMIPGLGQLLGAGRSGVPALWRTSQDAGHSSTLARGAAATLVLWGLKGYQLITDVVGLPWAMRAKWKGASAGSVLVIARP